MARKRFDDDEDDDDRPRRSRRRDDDDDDYDERPRRRRRKSESGFPAWAWVAIPLGILLVCGGGLTLMMSSVQKVKSAGQSSKLRNNLKQIGIGLHAQHDTIGNFAVPFALDDFKQSNPGLSWRVGILPFVEQDVLYRQFDRSKRWDDPRNQFSSNQIVSAYSTPEEPVSPTFTRLFGFNGPGALMDANRKFPTKLTSVTDGLSNTAMVAEVTTGAPWASPMDVPYTRNGPLPSLGAAGNDYFLLLLADGSVRNVKKNIPPAILHSLIQIDDGQAINWDGF